MIYLVVWHKYKVLNVFKNISKTLEEKDKDKFKYCIVIRKNIIDNNNVTMITETHILQWLGKTLAITIKNITFDIQY